MKTQPPTELFFHERSEVFDLAVLFNEDQVTICLKDFVDFIVYDTEYTEEDIGDKINRKFDLIDIYNAFSLTQTEADG